MLLAIKNFLNRKLNRKGVFGLSGSIRLVGSRGAFRFLLITDDTVRAMHSSKLDNGAIRSDAKG
jgi:hypothetical protein